MEENRKNNSQEDSSAFNYLVAFLIVIVIVGTSLAITPLGDILSKELVNSELLEYSDQKSLSKKDNTKIKDENEKIVYTYTAKYNHLDTENDILLDGTVFFSFPMPMIENNPAVKVSQKGKNIENSNIQLLAHQMENGEKITIIQMENGIKGKLVEPRQEVNFYLPFISKSENFTPKIMTQSSGDLFTKDFRNEGRGGAIYENESLRIEIKFSIYKEIAEELTLKNKKGEISAKVIGTTYGQENGHTHIPIQYSVSVSLSREIENEQKVDKYIFEAEEPVPKDKSVELKKIT